MNTEKMLLEELENTPPELLDDVTVNTFSPPVISSDIIESLVIGKEDVKPGETQHIELDDEEKTESKKDNGKTAKENKDSDSDRDADSDSDSDRDADSDSETFTLNDLVTPDMAIDILNLIIVTAGLILLPKFLDVKIEKSELEFTADEKKMIKKPLLRCFKETPVATKNPWLALVGVLIVVLGAKGATIYMNIQEKKEAEQRAKDLNALNRSTGEQAEELPLEFRQAKKAQEIRLNSQAKTTSTRKPGETRGRKPKKTD